MGRDNDLPARIEYYPNGRIELEEWYREGRKHRNNLPARITYHEKSGQVSCETWYKNGKYHRDGDLPAIIEYNEFSMLHSEEWYRDGIRHRDNRPACNWRLINGKLEVWYQDGNKYYEKMTKYEMLKVKRAYRFRSEK